MASARPAPVLSKIRLYPIKSLDPVELTEARIGPAGGLASDRAWALYDADGHWINGKRTPAVHFIRASFTLDLAAVTLAAPQVRPNLPATTIPFPGGTAQASDWFSAYFDMEVTVRHAVEGFPDDSIAAGPTIVSTASLEAVCSWFPEISLESARLRFRASLEISRVPAFWEDQLFGQDKNILPRFCIGDVALEGSNPCARCPVPPRDPVSGAPIEDFQKRFTELRRAHLPDWSPAARFDHFYRFATNTRVPATETDKTLRIGSMLTFQ